MTTTGKKRLIVEYENSDEDLMRTFKGLVYREGTTMNRKIIDLIREFIKTNSQAV